MQWPPDYVKEFDRRLVWKNKILDDELLQTQMQVYYATHCVDWINDWCVTFDPRAKPPLPRLMPFNMFKRQEEFVDFILSCFEDKQSGLTEKSRDMGATWICCAISIWLWLYHPGVVIGWGSLKERGVDKMGDPKAIFPKMRQILANLPRFMLPDGFRLKRDATYMTIINHANGASIIGEAGDDMGRGGRTSIYFKDESAHYLHPELIEAALGDNTDVQIDMSSVNGAANPFYLRRMAGVEWTPDCIIEPGKTRVFILDWRDHPKKTQEWYDLRYKKAEDEGMLHILRQEVDRDYLGSIDKVVIPQDWVRSCIDAHIKLGFTDDGLRRAAQDIADGGRDKNALAIAYGVVIRFCEHWGGEAGAAARHSVPIASEHGCKELYYDSVGVGVGYKTEINTMKREGTLPKSLRIHPWNGGGSVLDPEENIIPFDSESPTNEDQYLNLKAQSWFRLRTRIYKTHKAVTAGAQFHPTEMISFDSKMPKIHQLCLELSQAVHKPSLKGKTMIDKKPEAALSPNMADAVVTLFNPTKEYTVFDSME